MSQDVSTPAASKGRSKLVSILLIIVTALAAGGTGAYWMYTQRGHASPPPPPTPGIVNFDPFVVNLADTGGSRFLRVTLRLVLPDEHKAKELAESEVGRMRLRSAVLELLTLQTADRLVTPEGKAELKKSITERAEQAFGDAKVIDVLFSEFVVQF